MMAKHKDGRSVRVFLMVDRVDQSGTAHDALFLGSMVYVAESTPSEKSTGRMSVSSLSSSRGGVFRAGSLKRGSTQTRASSKAAAFADRRSIVTSDSVAMAVNVGGDTSSVYSRGAKSSVAKMRHCGSRSRIQPFVPPMTSKKCTVLVVETAGSQPEERTDAALLTRCYESLLQQLTNACTRTNGHLHCLIGDRAVVTFNATVPNTSHRPAAAHMMVHLHNEFKGTLLSRYRPCRTHVPRHCPMPYVVRRLVPCRDPMPR